LRKLNAYLPTELNALAKSIIHNHIFISSIFLKFLEKIFFTRFNTNTDFYKPHLKAACMLSINHINLSQKSFFNNSKINQSPKSPQECRPKTMPAGTYPKNYYTISFTASKMISLEEQLERIEESALPERIQGNVRKELEQGSKKNLCSIHRETYAPLLECRTLDEAKALFPEFQDVIDAKDLEESLMSSTMKRIKKGKIEGVKIEDLSLELLKSHYGRGLSPSHYKEAFFGLSKETIFRMLELLNIKRLDGKYLFLVNSSSPEKRAKNSAAWTKEKRAARSLEAIKEWDDEEKRKTLSKKKKQYYKDHPEAAEAHSKRLTGRTETPEHKANISRGVKRYRDNHPEVTAVQRQAWAEHNDITRKMSEIAKKHFPHLGQILAKRRSGEPLTQNDIDYEKCYYGVCEREIPGFRTIVARTYKKLLEELN